MNSGKRAQPMRYFSFMGGAVAQTEDGRAATEYFPAAEAVVSIRVSPEVNLTRIVKGSGAYADEKCLMHATINASQLSSGWAYGPVAGSVTNGNNSWLGCGSYLQCEANQLNVFLYGEHLFNFKATSTDFTCLIHDNAGDYTFKLSSPAYTQSGIQHRRDLVRPGYYRPFRISGACRVLKSFCYSAHSVHYNFSFVPMVNNSGDSAIYSTALFELVEV